MQTKPPVEQSKVQIATTAAPDPSAKPGAKAVVSPPPPLLGSKGAPVVVEVARTPEPKPDYNGDLISATIGLAGVLVGTFVAQHFARRNADSQAKAFRLSAIFAATQTLISMYSNVVGLKNHLTAGVKLYEDEKAQHKSLVILPYGNDPANAFWEDSALYTLYDLAGNYEIVNLLGDLPLRHNSLFTAFATYREQRLAVMNQMIADDVVDGVASGLISDEQLAALRPRLAMLDGVIDQLVALTEEAASDIYQAILAVLKLRGERLGEGLEFTLPNPQGETVELRTPPMLKGKRPRAR